jgi:hypothetical protein
VFRSTLVVMLVLAASTAVGASTTQAELDRWLASSPQIVPSKQRDLRPDSNLKQQVEIRGSRDVSGWVSPSASVAGSLANGQRVMIVPLISGGSGGTFETLLFTHLGGRTRFVGYVPSPNGHLDVAIDHGALLIRTPIYGPGSGGNCCPSELHYERATLRGIRLVTLKSWTVRAPEN